MTASEADRDARIDELEVRFSHQDQTVHELSNEIYRQQQQIARLASALRRLAAQLESAREGAATVPEEAERQKA